MATDSPLTPPRIVRAIVFGLTISLQPVAAQTGAWATDTAAPGLGGRVFSFATWQGQTYAGGHPFATRGGEIACLARRDGATWRPVGSGIDPVGGWASFAAPTIRSMGEYDGDLIVAGTFDVAGGQPRNNTARWDGRAWTPCGSGLGGFLPGSSAEGWSQHVRGNELLVGGDSFNAGGASPRVH